MTGATESVMRQPYAVPETKRAAAHRLFAGGRRETGLIAQVLRALLDLELPSTSSAAAVPLKVPEPVTRPVRVMPL